METNGSQVSILHLRPKHPNTSNLKPLGVWREGVMHVNVPVALSFVCGAPFSKAAGETSEDQLVLPGVFGWAKLLSFFQFSCWFKRKDVAEDTCRRWQHS